MEAILSELRPPAAGFLVASPRAPDAAVRVLTASFPRRLLQIPVCCIRKEGSRRGSSQKRKPAPDEPAEVEKGSKDPQPSGGESSGSSRQGEILELLKRIQLSVSEGEPGKREKVRERKTEKRQPTKSGPQSQGQGPARKQARGRRTSHSGDQEPSKQKSALKNNVRSEDSPPSDDFKPSRSPSNFFRRSPIPAPSPPRGGIAAAAAAPLTDERPAEEAPGTQEIDGLRLSELKELARSRGIRGYSKLKKGELVELLNRSVNPS